MIILRTVKNFSSLNIVGEHLAVFDGYFGGRYC
mgnify:CR=1 FL=1